MWISGDFPFDYRKATVIPIPIPKPGEDPINPTNYLPGVFISCIYKTMEQIINHRLVWYPESH